MHRFVLQTCVSCSTWWPGMFGCECLMALNVYTVYICKCGRTLKSRSWSCWRYVKYVKRKCDVCVYYFHNGKIKVKQNTTELNQTLPYGYESKRHHCNFSHQRFVVVFIISCWCCPLSSSFLPTNQPTNHHHHQQQHQHRLHLSHRYHKVLIEISENSLTVVVIIYGQVPLEEEAKHRLENDKWKTRNGSTRSFLPQNIFSCGWFFILWYFFTFDIQR